MTYEQILAENRGAVCILTLNRPDKLNAWTPKMSEELADAIARANDDTAIGAIVITGAGRGFCAGADMEDTFKKRIDGTDPGENTAEGQGGMPAGLDWVALCRESKPIVAAVNGAAVGIGLTQILPCDVIVASQEAKFGMGFIKMGLVPELASTHFLVQRMGSSRRARGCRQSCNRDRRELCREPLPSAAYDQAVAHSKRLSHRSCRYTARRE
jgi:enoyl-CoA hydratase/carnithine racemase